MRTNYLPGWNACLRFNRELTDPKGWVTLKFGIFQLGKRPSLVLWQDPGSVMRGFIYEVKFFWPISFRKVR